MKAVCRLHALLRTAAFLCLLAVGAVAQGTLTHESLPDIPTPLGLGGPVVGVHNKVLVVAGGANFPTPLTDGGRKMWHDEVWTLNRVESSWSLSGRLPTPIAYAAVASTPKGICVVGGSDEKQVYRSAYLLTIADGVVKVDSLPNLPHPTAFGQAECIGEMVYLLDGKAAKDDTKLSGGFWVMDLAHQGRGWESLPAPPGRARFKSVTAVQRAGPGDEPCFFMFSGSRVTRSADGTATYEMYTDAHRYVPSARTWVELSPLPVLSDPRAIRDENAHDGERWPINAGCAHGFGSHQILTFGGSTGRYIKDTAGKIVSPGLRPNFAGRVLSFNTRTNTWTDMKPMPEGVVTTRAVKWNELLVIPSGEIRPGIRTPHVSAVRIPDHDSATAMEEAARLHSLDFLVLGVYLAAMVGIGLYFARRDKTTNDFFLAGGRIPWWAAGLSIFGTQLSAITFMAVPATAFAGDWRRFAGSIMMLPVFVIVIFCFVPIFRRLRIATAYEYLELRFSPSVRTVAASLFILFQMGRIGIVLLLPALALSAVTGFNVHLCIAVMGLLATVYTALGGISAVIWTDVLQVVVLVGGALLCLLAGSSDVGGLGAVWEMAQAEGKTAIFHWEWSHSDMVGWVVIVGFFFTNLVPYTTDQTIIQRYLTTRDEGETSRSLWLNLIITIPTGLLFYGLGTTLWAYYQTQTAEAAVLPAAADQLVPWFVVTQLPSGIAGLLIAAIFAAAMSSLDSSMNSISSSVINDFLSRFRQKGRNDLKLAKALTIALGVLGTSTAMVLATVEIRFLFDFFQKVIGLFGGGVAGVFMLAVFTRRATSAGAWAGLIAGGGATILVAYLTEISFLLYAGVGSVTCVVVGYLFSLVQGGASENRQLDGLTFIKGGGEMS